MKLKSISICNMHKIPGTSIQKYDLNDVTYFIGPNGAGKSTVLQAIQLALLGYIPGYDKTNSGILKHSNDGKSIEVTAELAEGDSTYTVTRKWYKSGSSVKSEVKATPAEFDIKSIIKDLELPVFNFNEFKNMTSNKLKEWFIQFLPKDTFSIDWKEYLTSELGTRSSLLSDELMDEILSMIDDLESQGLKGVELVQKLNDQLKTLQSFTKSSLDRLQSTVNSLIYYQDVEDSNSDMIQDKITSVRSLRDQVVKYNAQQEAVESAKNKLAELNLSYETASEDPTLDKMYADLDAINDELNHVTAEYNNYTSEHSKVSIELAKISVTSNICPYTKTVCDEITKRQESAVAEQSKLKARSDEIASKIQEISTTISQLKTKKNTCEWNIDQLSERYQLAGVYRSTIESASSAIPTAKTVAELDIELGELQQQLIKVEANKKFSELNDTITADKYRAENNLEVIKTWIASTGPNGLQTYMMEKPFEALADDLSSYLKTMYGQDVSGKFRIEEKANSFSFGLVNSSSNEFVEFDLLSSGEKCLFTVALIMCIICRSNSSFRLILADDMLDHLDDNNAERLFNLLEDTGIQFVMAGVKPCKNDAICIQIGG